MFVQQIGNVVLAQGQIVRKTVIFIYFFETDNMGSVSQAEVCPDGLF